MKPGDLTLKANEKAKLGVKTIGKEGSQLIIIDDAIANIDELQNHALTKASYGPPPSDRLYPGLNSVLEPSIVFSTLNILSGGLKQVFGMPAMVELTCSGYFGLITTPPNDLSKRQTIPHYDVTGTYCVAILIYLCGPTHGGTGFYRHKSTGFERITAARRPEFIDATETQLNQSPPQQAYFKNSDAHFEKIGEVEARYNRLVVYNSNLLHAPIVNEALLSDDPKAGRLTCNIFAFSS